MFKKIIFFLMVFASTASFAQRIKIDKKKLQFLKNETKIGVKLTFPDDLVFHNNMKEREFIEDKIRKLGGYDSDRSKKWKSKYDKGKKEEWRTSFLSIINERLKKYSELRFIESNEEVDHLLIIEADWMYFGYNTFTNGPQEEAKLEVTLNFVKASDPETIIYSTQTPKVIGSFAKTEFSDITRVEECYKRLGFLLELQLKRILK